MRKIWMLDTGLLGNLSEEELSIVKHAPIKEMEATEKNALTEGEEMQAYLAVLLSEKSFISVTDDGREYYLNNYHLRRGRYDEIGAVANDGVFSVENGRDGYGKIVSFEADGCVTDNQQYQAVKVISGFLKPEIF